MRNKIENVVSRFGFIITLPATSLWLEPILLAEVRQRAAKSECEARMRRERMERWRDISIGNSRPSCTASITLRSNGSRTYKVTIVACYAVISQRGLNEQ